MFITFKFLIRNLKVKIYTWILYWVNIHFDKSQIKDQPKVARELSKIFWIFDDWSNTSKLHCPSNVQRIQWPGCKKSLAFDIKLRKGLVFPCQNQKIMLMFCLLMNSWILISTCFIVTLFACKLLTMNDPPYVLNANAWSHYLTYLLDSHIVRMDIVYLHALIYDV